jgi:hypothetical protein
MSKTGVLICGLSLYIAMAVPVASRAQDKLAEITGSWEFRADYSNSHALQVFKPTPAETKAMAAHTDSLAALVGASKIFNPPLGFQARARARHYPLWCELNHNCTAGPPVPEFELDFFPFNGINKRTGRPDWGGEVFSNVTFWINDTASALPRDCFGAGTPYRMTDRRKICLQPAESRRLAGRYPVFFEKGIETSALMNGRPVCAPVTAEEFLEAIIGSRLARLDDQDKNYGRKDPGRPASERVLVDPIRRELAALKPGQRRLQAWYLAPQATPTGLPSGLVPPGTASAKPVITENPNYFDRACPPSEIQLITVTFLYYFLVDKPAESSFLGNRRLWEFSNAADWPRIAGLVAHAPPPK